MESYFCHPIGRAGTSRFSCAHACDRRQLGCQWQSGDAWRINHVSRHRRRVIGHLRIVRKRFHKSSFGQRDDREFALFTDGINAGSGHGGQADAIAQEKITSLGASTSYAVVPHPANITAAAAVTVLRSISSLLSLKSGGDSN